MRYATTTLAVMQLDSSGVKSGTAADAICNGDAGSDVMREACEEDENALTHQLDSSGVWQGAV